MTFDLIFMNCGVICNLNHVNYPYGLYAIYYSSFPVCPFFFLLKSVRIYFCSHVWKQAVIRY